MQDKRIARGSTYAAMVIPAGTNPDAMIMEKRQEERKRKTVKKVIISYCNLCAGLIVNSLTKRNLPQQRYPLTRASAR